eukprot:CAMPEP_0185736310 /NCGR_PEP_ID=MMETSP1171-20130828/27498_1 /TAXON_ID=374046 /ORGANISM="Helicotheca tamensis, Strain CCMP826" /LENGTH=339 /DNA_ID=CAMNT_0028406871 /DNA_START=120 /DNA_END=1136 /DNA_ORIENTATION=+
MAITVRSRIRLFAVVGASAMVILLNECLMKLGGINTRSLRSAAEQVRDAHLYALAALEGLKFEELNEAVLMAKDEAAASSEESRQRISEAESRLVDEHQLPRMHTFWEPLEKNGGMTAESNEAMLNLWRAAWKAAGWEPVVLTMKDAMNHPDFENFNHTLSTDMPFGGYDVVCFLRYLAMAQAGGGWMADYDVFPLNPLEKGGSMAHLPNNGKFTLYEKQLVGPGAVPSLVSGRQTEWERVAHLLYESALEHREADHWSDFFAFIEIDDTRHGQYIIEDAVLQGRRALTGRLWKEEDCTVTQGKIAVHFAHDAIIRGNTRDDEVIADRPRIAQSWLELW